MSTDQSSARIERILRSVDCDRCGKTHQVKVDVTYEPAPLAFGGKSEQVSTVELEVTCPATGTRFSAAVEVPAYAGQEIVGYVSIDSRDAPRKTLSTGVEATPSREHLIDELFDDWHRNSLSLARSYGISMLSTSTAAAGAYFPILKYFGISAIGPTPLTIVAILPPIGYFFAAATFALALRPQLKRVARWEFLQHYEHQTQAVHRWLTSGTITFLLSTVLALIVFGLETLK